MLGDEIYIANIQTNKQTKAFVKLMLIQHVYGGDVRKGMT
jgi:hypothetical protein